MPLEIIAESLLTALQGICGSCRVHGCPCLSHLRAVRDPSAFLWLLSQLAHRVASRCVERALLAITFNLSWQQCVPRPLTAWTFDPFNSGQHLTRPPSLPPSTHRLEETHRGRPSRCRHCVACRTCAALFIYLFVIFCPTLTPSSTSASASSSLSSCYYFCLLFFPSA